MQDNKRVGLYYWAGPGTIRMIKLKYPGSKVNKASLLRAYDLDILKLAKDKLGVTDAWVSFNWGFAPNTEVMDQVFTLSKLTHFKQLGILTHGYIQGTNLVYEDHKDKDYFCRDYWGRLIPYHRGRMLTCINNPFFKEYLFSRVDQALTAGFDGIYIDNVIVGLMPLLVNNGKTTFFGCACKYCRNKFDSDFGGLIKDHFVVDSELFGNYVNFRSASAKELLTELSRKIHQKGKQFGINSYDPGLDTKFYLGVDVQDSIKFQDYLLIENHSLPADTAGNGYLTTLIDSSPNPIFVVSYRKGIGRESAYTQHQINAIFSESRTLGYRPCYKASEFVTRGIWHNLDFKTVTTPASIKVDIYKHKKLARRKILPFSLLFGKINVWYTRLLTYFFEYPLARYLFNWLYYRAIR